VARSIRFSRSPYAATQEYERAIEFLGDSPIVAPRGRVIAENTRAACIAGWIGNSN